MRRTSSKNRSRDTRNIAAAGAVATFGLAYISFMMVLLVFFIYLNAHSTVNTIKQSQVLESLSTEFLSKLREEDSPLTIIKTAQSADFEVIREDDRFIITMPGAKVFDSGDDQIRPEVTPVLNRIASLAAQFNLDVTIEGHTDNQPIHSVRFHSNWSLSTARAVSVLRLFMQQGLPAERLSASGRSDFHPIDTNETDEGRARNRRVVLIVSSKPTPSEGEVS